MIYAEFNIGTDVEGRLCIPTLVTTTLANLSLDHHGLQGKQLGANRSTEPTSSRIAAIVSNCSFKVVEDEVSPGDQITVQCAFSSSVSVVGTPVLMLNANLMPSAIPTR